MTRERSRGQSRTTRSGTSAGRVVAAMLAMFVLVGTGFAWHSVDALMTGLERLDGLGLGGGEDGAVDILLVGTDSRTDAHGNPLSEDELAKLRVGPDVTTNTDTIMLVRVPNDGSSATAISIPRDSYVDVPGIGMSKINAAYGATYATRRQELIDSGETEADADKQAVQAGRQALIKSVAKLTGITVDHYAEIGLLGFALLTDAVGGVEVCLKEPVDEWMSGANFPAGDQTLSGGQALSFVRQRHDLPRGDIDRIVRQQVFMASLVHKVLSAKTLSNPAKLQELSDAVTRSVVLDSNWDVVRFAKQLQDLAGGDVKFETIPVDDLNGMTDYGESVVLVDPAKVRRYVATLVGGGTSTPRPLDKSAVAVDVVNASGVEGLASRVATALTTEGFRRGAVSNYGSSSGSMAVSTTTVYARDDTDEGAAAVAEAIGAKTIEADSSLAEGKVKVVLAPDYAGPGSDDYAGSTSAMSSSETSTTATPVPPAPPIDAGRDGPKCVN